MAETMEDPKGATDSRILLMSPDASVTEEKARCLSQAGWQVLRSGDAVEAFAAVKSRNVDLALLYYPLDEAVDMDLPNVLRTVAPADYLPVVVLAADTDRQEWCRHLNSGADDVISQEAPVDELIARVRALLRVKLLSDQLSESRLALQESIRRERKLLVKVRQDNIHLQALCATDPLTHVQNIRSFRNILDHEFRIARRYGRSLSLMVMDVDHFKVINDTHGHPSGDYVLKELAVILKKSVRDSDVVARTGGDEFNILLPNADARQAARFAGRIRQQVFSRKFIVYGQQIHATLSIGMATCDGTSKISEPGMLVYLADQALLLAKEDGRDRVTKLADLTEESIRRLTRQYHRSKGAPQDLPALTGVEEDY